MTYLFLIIASIIVPIISYKIESHYLSDSHAFTILFVLIGIMTLFITSIVKRSKAKKKATANYDIIDIGMDRVVEGVIDTAIDAAGEVIDNVDIDL